MVCLMWDTASRIRAILRLRKDNLFVDDDNMPFLYMKEKRRQRLKKFLTNSTYELLNSYISSLPKGSSKYIFFPDMGKITSEDIDNKYYEVWSMLKNISRKLFGTGMSPHWFRRGRAYKVLKDTKDIIKAQTILGHKSLESTRIYLEADAEELKNIVKKEKRPW